MHINLIEFMILIFLFRHMQNVLNTLNDEANAVIFVKP